MHSVDVNVKRMATIAVVDKRITKCLGPTIASNRDSFLPLMNCFDVLLVQRFVLFKTQMQETRKNQKQKHTQTCYESSINITDRLPDQRLPSQLFF